jgi:hypothetical protein
MHKGCDDSGILVFLLTIPSMATATTPATNVFETLSPGRRLAVHKSAFRADESEPVLGLSLVLAKERI